MLIFINILECYYACVSCVSEFYNGSIIVKVIILYIDRLPLFMLDMQGHI